MAKFSRANISHPALLGLLVLAFAGILTYAIVSYSELDNATDAGLPVIPPRAVHSEAQAIANQSDNQLTQLQQQSSGDDVASIERDLNATILSGLDAETGTVLNELQGL